MGKELVANSIHQLSPRAHRAMSAVNCAGLSETLLESELFGHVKGSFTGAYRDKQGKLEMADGGTIFLDEIGEMTLRMQGMLLRFLETGELQKVGTDRVTTRVDVRIVAATNKNLREMVTQGHFREDLFYRLNVIQLAVPPLARASPGYSRDDRFVPGAVHAQQRPGGERHLGRGSPTAQRNTRGPATSVSYATSSSAWS